MTDSLDFSEFNLFASIPTETWAIPLLVLVFAGILRLFTRRTFRSSRNFRGHDNGSGWINMADPKAQIDAVAQADFAPQRLLNKEEYRLLPILETIVSNAGQNHRLVIQTSLGKVLSARSPSREAQRRAYASINSKRIDFGIINGAGILKVAVEYQGSGHYRDNSFMRDAVKREALRKAGIHTVEVKKDFAPDLLRAEIASHLA